MVKSIRMRWDQPVARMVGWLVANPEGKRPLRRPRHRWEDNIRMDLREVGWEGVDWMHLAQDRNQWQTLVSAVMKLQVS
jgi:hypothetical protein